MLLMGAGWMADSTSLSTSGVALASQESPSPSSVESFQAGLLLLSGVVGMVDASAEMYVSESTTESATGIVVARINREGEGVGGEREVSEETVE